MANNGMNTELSVSWNDKQQDIIRGLDQQRLIQQAQAGKKTVRERIALLLDAGSFEELDLLALSPHLSTKLYTDGVVVGMGTVAGKKVAVYAQDFTIKGGSLGHRHAEKIIKIMDHAAKIGCPIIGIIDSGGARIDEGIHALHGYGQVFSRNTRYSGVVPQISVILGPCAGGAAYSPALTDFVFMTEQISNMFITGPNVIKQAIHQDIDKESLGGSQVHARMSGVAHVVAASEDECFQKLKMLLALLPDNYVNNTQAAPFEEIRDDDGLALVVPQNFQQAYDMHQVIMRLVDKRSFFEIQELFAPNIIVGFARLNGMTIGLVANQPSIKAGTIDIDASCKAARFIQFCDSFSIPLISLVDVPGFLPGVDQEHHGIIRHGAKLLYAYAQATIPKITVILRKAFGGAYIVMGSKSLGADVNFAWPQAQIAVLGAREAIAILHGKKISQYPEHEQKKIKSGLEAAYEEEFLNPVIAAQSGYIDAIIDPKATRRHLIKALYYVQNKVEHIPKKKHGNIPL